MNVALDVITVAILIGNVISGIKKGFFKTLLSLVCLITTVVLICVYASPLGDIINKKVISPALAQTVINDTEIDGQEAVDNIEKSSLFGGKLLNDIFESEIPSKDSDGLTVKEYLVGLINESDLVISLCSCLGAVLITLVVRLAAWLLGLIIEPILKLPILKEANKGLGFIVGLINGVLLMWVVCLIVNIGAAAYKPTSGTFRSEVVEQTLVYKYADEYNPANIILK